MRKVTIYDGPIGSETVFAEGEKELGVGRMVKEIVTDRSRVQINYEGGGCKIYTGFRFIFDDNGQEKKGQ